jgi:glycosyltransferase involved in cell wall biosynthesis
MNIIMVHNYYQQSGGEDQVFRSESNLLESKGHKVIRYTMHNDCIENINTFKLSINTFWNQKAVNSLEDLVRRHSTQVIHFHNTFPLISPGSYYAKGKKGPVVIQTLHNFRILCPGALFFRNGNVCERCLLKVFPWPGAVKVCYRKSFLASAVTVAMLGFHQLLRTWKKKVNRFIALTEFAKEKFIRAGFPSDRIKVKPHFIHPDPGMGNFSGKYALFVGRISKEKGILTLLKACEKIIGFQIKIIGDGPLIEDIYKIRTNKNLSNVELLGQQVQKKVFQFMKNAMFILFPSECYETFGLICAEAFACGKPVITSRLGSMAEIVENGVTGLHFEPGDSDDLANKIRWLLDHPNECRRMGKNVRKVFLEKYTAEKNYEILMNIYENALNEV